MIGLMGWLGSGLVVMSLIQRDIRRLRQVNLAASAVLGIFNVALGIASMIALNAVLAAVNAFHLARERSVDRTSSPTPPAPATARGVSGTVRPDDARPVLERHRASAGMHHVV